jgi:hypothetical protein
MVKIDELFRALSTASYGHILRALPSFRPFFLGLASQALPILAAVQRRFNDVST